MITTMETKQGYQKTKLGWIPVDWDIFNIQEVFERTRKPVSLEKGTDYIQIGIRSHAKGIFIKKAKTGEELGKKSCFWLEPDRLIVNIVFAWEQAIGKTTNEHIGLIASHRFPMYKPNIEKVDLDYVVYLFKTPLGKYLLGLASPGGAGRNKTLGQKEFLNLKLPLPPLPEQKKIAKILSTWDTAITKTKALIEKKQVLKKGLMQVLLTGKVRFGEFGHKEERIKTKLDSFVSSWEIVKLGDLYDRLSTGMTPSRKYPKYFNGDILWVTSGELNYNTITNTKEKITEEARKNTNLRIYPKGTFFIAITGLEASGTRGRCAILGKEATTNQSCMAFPFNERVDTLFLFYFYCNYGNKIAFRFAQGTKQQSLNSKIVKSLKIPLPPLPEQKKIAKVLSTCDQAIQKLKDELAQLQAQKKGLMQQLLTGATRVKVEA